MDHKTQIFVFDDVISDKLCDTIRLIIDKTDGYIEDYRPNQNVKCKSVTIKDIADSKSAITLDTEVYNVVNKIAEKIMAANTRISIRNDCGYQFRKIHGPTRYHSDGIFSSPPPPNVNNVRTVSLVIALNDDYKGGEFCFPDQNFKIKLKKGQAIAFPPFWTHPHYTNELLDGTFRYTINTWFHQ